MKQFLLTIILAVAFTLPTFADSDSSDSNHRRKWRSEMRQVKADYIAKELQLTDAQKSEFVPLCVAMDEEIDNIATTLRRTEREVLKKGESATDADYSAASQALFEQRSKESAVEAAYYKKFSKVLSPKQLFKYKAAERKFMLTVMEKRPDKGPKEGGQHKRKQSKQDK